MMNYLIYLNSMVRFSSVRMHYFDKMEVENTNLIKLKPYTKLNYSFHFVFVLFTKFENKEKTDTFKSS